MRSHMHNPVAVIHVQAAVCIPERLPRINDDDVRSANLRQFPIDVLGAGHTFEDRIYSWYDGIGCRRHGLRRGGDDVAMHLPLDTERPNPLDVSGYYLGTHRIDGDAALACQLDDVDAAIDFSENEQNFVSSRDA